MLVPTICWNCISDWKCRTIFQIFAHCWMLGGNQSSVANQVLYSIWKKNFLFVIVFFFNFSNSVTKPKVDWFNGPAQCCTRQALLPHPWSPLGRLLRPVWSNWPIHFHGLLGKCWEIIMKLNFKIFIGSWRLLDQKMERCNRAVIGHVTRIFSWYSRFVRQLWQYFTGRWNLR